MAWRRGGEADIEHVLEDLLAAAAVVLEGGGIVRQTAGAATLTGVLFLPVVAPVHDVLFGPQGAAMAEEELVPCSTLFGHDFAT